jgi:tRNA(Arg) A34 adenosine deaminase TadA/catechol 2,3-dioxygenase-like lactoylglutathione lyase family enzyme
VSDRGDHLLEAVRLAEVNAQAGGLPFGAVVVRDGEVIATGVNTVRRFADPTRHAETEAIRAACARLGTLDLTGAEIVSSCEPCPLCQSAAALAGVPRIVFAASAAEAASAGMVRTSALAAMADALGVASGGVAVVPAPPEGHAALEAAGTDRRAPFRVWLAWLDAGGDAGTVAQPVQELRLALTVDDHDAAVRFYRDVLGLPQAADWDSPNGRVRVLDAGRATLELIDAAQAAYIDDVEVGRRVAGPIRVALQVDDPAATAEALVAAGAERLGGPVVTPWGDRNVRIEAPGLQLTLFAAED